ncbi:MAG: DUF1194 domain-containing protein [Paracoccaceae bacterium]
MIRPLLACLALLLPTASEASCRLALALGLDVSGSVDEREYRLQLDGLAAALSSDRVAQKLLASPDTPVAIAIYEWSGLRAQRLILDWTLVRKDEDLERITATLTAYTRRPENQATALGAAMRYAADLFERGPACWQKTLDLSGDGKNNEGYPPTTLHRDPDFADITVNGLVIGSDSQTGDDERQMEIMELSAYFRRRVIHGPGAFIEVALGFEDYERAMTRKLLREVEGIVVGQARLP